MSKNPPPATFAPDAARLGEQDYHLFNEGSHYRLYRKLGAHPSTRDGVAGTQFAVWAPGAENVYVFGDFNGWNKSATRLEPQGVSGIWVGFVPGVGPGAAYKYHVHSRFNGYRVDKADPSPSSARSRPRPPRSSAT
jgi:1,4-alpha-glucan branching enzyme